MRALLFVVLVASDVVVAPGGVLPEGTHLAARMNTTIGTTRSLGVDRIADATRVGAPFAATVDARIVDEHGRTQLPAGAILYGHVTRLERGEGVRHPKIELAVDRLDGRPLQARVTDAEVQDLPATDTATAAEATAFWGALFGGVVFGIPGVAFGYGFGGSAGAVNATRARRIEGWISAGSIIEVELEAPLPLRRCVATRDGAPHC